MIRSCRIPSVLRKICNDDVLQTALLVTTDGELLGSTATTFVSPNGTSKESIESLGTLIADIAVDYSRLGDEYSNLDPDLPKKSSHLQCLFLELELGLVAVSLCVGVDCMVIAIAQPSAPLGSVKAKLQAITAHVQEALGPLVATEAMPTSYR